MHLNASNMHLSAVVWFRQSLMQTKNATTFCCQERQKCVHQSQPFGSHLRQGRKSRSKVEKKKVLKGRGQAGAGFQPVDMPHKATEAMTWADDWAIAGTMVVPAQSVGLAGLRKRRAGRGGGGRGNALTGVFVRGHNRTTACSISLACVRLCVYT